MKKVLFSADGSHFIVDADQNFHCRDGMIPKDVISKGGSFTAKSGTTFYIIDAFFTDLFLHLKRGAQIVLPKDIGCIIAESGITNKSIVVDAGTGSGALSSYLALHAKKVYTFDNRKEHLEVSAKNFALFGLKNIVAKELDLYEKDVTVKNVDLVTLDLTEPWRAIPHVEKAMKPGAFLIAYNPQISQAIQLVNDLKGNKNFFVLKVLENMQREWEIDGHISRPRFNQIAHTGFLTITRKV